MEIHEYLELDTNKETINCLKCGEYICKISENFKNYCVMTEKPMAAAGPDYRSPAEIQGDGVRLDFRQFYCPGCAVLIDHEISRPEDEILHDIEIEI